VIDRAVFGDAKADSDSDSVAHLGKQKRLLWQITEYADGFPFVDYERIGITPDDVKNPAYADYVLESNTADSSFDRNVADTGGIEDFPTVETEYRGAKRELRRTLI
jgi:hypothetical protein